MGIRIPFFYPVGGIPTPLKNMKVRLDHHRNYLALTSARVFIIFPNARLISVGGPIHQIVQSNIKRSWFQAIKLLVFALSNPSFSFIEVWWSLTWMQPAARAPKTKCRRFSGNLTCRVCLSPGNLEMDVLFIMLLSCSTLW